MIADLTGVHRPALTMALLSAGAAYRDFTSTAFVPKWTCYVIIVTTDWQTVRTVSEACRPELDDLEIAGPDRREMIQYGTYQYSERPNPRHSSRGVLTLLHFRSTYALYVESSKRR